MTIDPTRSTPRRLARHDGTGRRRRIADWVDDRIGVGELRRATRRKVFPDHWSFMLGEIALY